LLRIGIIAGESSGDQLGAALITALKALDPEVHCFGVAGPKMTAAGCEAWATVDELSVMGLAEVLPHLPRLLRLRSSLVARFITARPDVFVGIDAPAFNLGIARRLRARGVKTVQYVAPQVWAWRPGRAREIGRAVDRVLCLLPFEVDFFARYGVSAVFVGHPLADQIPLDVDRRQARDVLGIDQVTNVVAILPGSRVGEVERLGTDFVEAARWLAVRRPQMQFVAPMASPNLRRLFEKKLLNVLGAPPIRVLDGQSHVALAAADAAIVASGTATLETLLTGRPMVAAYRFGRITAFVLRSLGLVKVQYFSQPNLLVGRRLVPELLQEQVSGEAIGACLLAELDDHAHLAELSREFRRVHESLRCGGATRAAAAIVDLARGKPPSS
jgi:lipid-A-disaccharide synthase